MKTLHRYLLRQVIASLVMTMLVFIFVLVIGSALRELLPLVVKGQVSLFLLVKAVGLLIPFLIAFALPMAMLTSTLLVFGRFSADSELTAARASGVSLLSLAAPILMFGLAMCAVCAVINMEIAPRCRVAYNDVRSEMGSQMANFKLPEGQYVDFPPAKPGDSAFTIFARRNVNQNLRDVLVYEMEDPTNSKTIIAPTGFLMVDAADQKLILNLTNATSSIFPGGLSFFGSEAKFVVDLNSQSKHGVDITDMTFGQLQKELRKRSISPPLPLTTTNSVVAQANKKRLVRRTTVDFTEPICIQMHKEIAFSFACFGFTLIGIPLGIRVHRRETNVGIFIALALVLIYYTIQVFGQSLASHAEYAPHLLMWVPNLIFQAIGAVLLWRANRGI